MRCFSERTKERIDKLRWDKTWTKKAAFMQHRPYLSGFHSIVVKVAHLSSMSGNAIHGCLQTCWPLSSKAVVLVLCNTLVLQCKTLVCAACMHASTALQSRLLT